MNVKSPLLPLVLLLTSAICLGLSGCVVAGASSSGGWFIWPGGLGLVVVVLVILMLMRRR